MFDLAAPPFQSARRPAVYAADAMAATSHPSASLTAVEVLRAGGNAVDAGVAAALMLTVAEPMMTGLGGDMFALYAPPGASARDVIALNGSGRAARAVDPDRLFAEHGAQLPLGSVETVTIPGAVGGLCRLLEDHGRFAFGRVAEAAIRSAEYGLPVAPRTAFDWAFAAARLQGVARDRLLSADGAAPAVGARVRAEGMAEVMRRIAAGGARAFYEGEIAEDMVASLRALGGPQTLEDFAAAAPTYVAPISARFHDLEVLTPPPNGQGAVALLLLEMLARLPLAGLAPFGVDRLHLEAEAVARAYAARDRLLADPDTPEGGVAAHLRAEGLAAELVAEIDPARATPPRDRPTPAAPHKDTVYLCVVDAEGGALSLIVSLFHAFGSGLASNRFGVVFQNRGAGFSLTPGHPNRIAPGKRPLHTLVPSLAFRDGRAAMAFGVMGGQYQAAGQARLLSNLCDFGLGLQAAVDAPRSFSEGGGLTLEAGHGGAVLEGLAGRGHLLAASARPIGGAQAIRIDRTNGVLEGASDPRKDGCALGF